MGSTQSKQWLGFDICGTIRQHPSQKTNRAISLITKLRNYHNVDPNSDYELQLLQQILVEADLAITISFMG